MKGVLYFWEVEDSSQLGIKQKLNISMPEPLFGKLVTPQPLSQCVLKLITYNTQGYQEMYYFETQLSVQIFFKTVIYVLLYYDIKIRFNGLDSNQGNL